MEMYYTGSELSKFEKFIVMLNIDDIKELKKFSGKDKDLMDVEKSL